MKFSPSSLELRTAAVGGYDVDRIASEAIASDRRPVSVGVYDRREKETVITWMSEDSKQYVQSYDEFGNESNKKLIGTSLATDFHNYPTLIQLDDGRYMAFYQPHHALHTCAPAYSWCTHDPNLGRFKTATSSQAHDITSWTSEFIEEGSWGPDVYNNLDGALGAAYPMPVKVANGDVYLFYRESLALKYNNIVDFDETDRPVTYMRLDASTST